MNFDWKCSITAAILTVLIYLLMVKLVSHDNRPVTLSTTEDVFRSDAFLVLVSAFIAFVVNANLFQGCGKTNGW